MRSSMFSALIVTLIIFSSVFAREGENDRILTIANSKISLTLNISNDMLKKEVFAVLSDWAESNRSKPFEFSTDGNFRFDIMWTYWDAPGKKNNADVEVTLTASDFKIVKGEERITENDDQSIELILTSKKYPFEIDIKYFLGKDDFFVKKTTTIKDSLYSDHFLRKFYAYDSKISGSGETLNGGGFGQPVAFKASNGGVFIGVEYPIMQTELKSWKDYSIVKCSEEVGKKITAEGIENHPVVIGLTPRGNVKYWFNKYLDNVRVAKLVPYTLYNSWYDLRSVEYPGVPEKFWMNEKNVYRIIEKIKKNFIDDHGIQIDAVVLDDGWDIYESDWKLRTKQFPNGMRPLADKLSETNTALGIWFGPTGGYSFRMKRINWMKERGYEVVGSLERDWQAMLCLAGTNYKKLFKKRVTDFVKKDNVAYFKWDGIQFSCSEPDHGHPVGVYSRRAVMESVEEMCGAVREINPNVFLNITSGTWLSPWWLKYANTIWMQGGDYGYSNVPSISRRDRAITYRDITLYNDFVANNFWYPISGLMTHGIIKGELQKLGGEAEPLDKFTDNAVLYFARGVAMYELYISPDILTKDEWDAIAFSLEWAKENFDILMNASWVGGNPAESEPYGYAHFNGDNGIIALRNPKIKTDKVKIKLSVDEGLNFDAKDLVIQKIYPRKVTYDKLYQADDEITVNLDGFETAVFKVFPLSEAAEPLICGAELAKDENGNFLLLPAEGKLKILSGVENISVGGKAVSEDELKNLLSDEENIQIDLNVKKIDNSNFNILFDKPESVANAEIAVFIKPAENSKTKKLPKIKGVLNGKETSFTSETEKGGWAWHSLSFDSGKNNLQVTLRKEEDWKGTAEVYLIYQEKVNGVNIELSKIDSKNYLPRPWKEGCVKRTKKVEKIIIE